MPLPFPYIPGVIKVALEFSFTGGWTAVNTHHVTRVTGGTDPYDQADLADVLDVFGNRYNETGTLLLSTDGSLDLMTATDIGAANAEQASAVPPSPPGGRTGGALPPQVSLCVTRRTTLTGRRRRGRVFTVWGTETDNDLSKVDDGLRDDVIAWYEDLQADLFAAGYVESVASHQDGLWTPVTVYTANLRWDTQKRRAQRIDRA